MNGYAKILPPVFNQLCGVMVCSMALVVAGFGYDLEAAFFYVSIEGNDENPGTLENPFRTIGKAAEIMEPGDNCIIREGIYRERVNVQDDDVTFRRYEDEEVVVSGADLVSGWTQYSGEIYRAPLSWTGHEFTQVFYNGAHQQIARYPDNLTGDMLSPTLDSGYMPCETFKETGATRRVTFPDMDTFPDNFWQGGTYRGITGRIRSNTLGDIVSSSGKDLICTPISNDWKDRNDEWYMGGGATGYILHLNALSREGEWWHEDGYLYFWQPGGGVPPDHSVEAQVREEAFNIVGRSGVMLSGLDIKAATMTLNNSNSCRIENCSFENVHPFFKPAGYSSGYGVVGGVYVAGDNNVVDSCYFSGSWGHLLYINSGNGNQVLNSVFMDNGWYSIFSSCIHNRSASETTIEHCTFSSTGRFHVRTDANEKITIRYCDFSDCLKVGQDAGSIQSVGKDLKNSEFAYNTIHDSSTVRVLNTGGDKQFVVAFYIEDTSNYTAHHNIVWNYNNDTTPNPYPDGSFSYLGPRETQQSGIRYFNNTAWDCDYRIRVWNRNGAGGIATSHWNNIFDNTMSDEFGTPSLESGFDFQNTVSIAPETGEKNFTDAGAGDFSLLPESSAVDAGRVIDGITDGYVGDAPDAGAIEAGTYMWQTGASINNNLRQKPFGGEVHSIPGDTIEAEDYDLGGIGIAYHDLTRGNQGGEYRSDHVDLVAAGEGVAVGSTVGGEWLEYTVNVEPGDYRIRLKASAIRDNREIRLQLDGSDLVTVTIPHTGGLQSYQEIEEFIAITEKSARRLRVCFDSGGTNLDSIEFEPLETVGYFDWAESYQLIGEEGDPIADPDKDRLSNIIEYALGGDPAKSQNRSMIPEIRMAGDKIEVVHLVRNGPDKEFEYQLEWSENLQINDWISTDITITSIKDLGTGFSEVISELPIDSVRKFLRLKVERP